MLIIFLFVILLNSLQNGIFSDPFFFFSEGYKFHNLHLKKAMLFCNNANFPSKFAQSEMEQRLGRGHWDFRFCGFGYFLDRFFGFGGHCGLRIFRFLASGFRFSRKILSGFSVLVPDEGERQTCYKLGCVLSHQSKVLVPKARHNGVSS